MSVSEGVGSGDDRRRCVKGSVAVNGGRVGCPHREDWPSFVPLDKSSEEN